MNNNILTWTIQAQIGRYSCLDLEKFDIIECDFNMDGLPLYKSSRQCVWPIMGAFVGDRNLSPFVVALFEGTSHPTSSEDFLKEFSVELNH